jgi:serine/threonine protein kinase
MRTGTDEGDGRPTWEPEPAEELVSGWHAWELLGRGHRCEAWLAWSPERWCTGVVKLARPHQVDHPRARRSLGREARALRHHPHPVLPTLFVDGSRSAVPHLVQQYVDGPALDELVEEEGVLDPVPTALLGLHLLGALVSLHGRGIVHLDLKPDNVMIDEGRPVLVDFGSSRPIGGRRARHEPIGTAGYLAPSLEAGGLPATAHDVFGIGAVLAEAMTGLRPDQQSPTPAGRWPLDSLPEGPVVAAVRRLLEADDATRPTVADALVLLAATLPEDHEPWPAGLTPPAAAAALRTGGRR